jgi:hypothetical protein
MVTHPRRVLREERLLARLATNPHERRWFRIADLVADCERRIPVLRQHVWFPLWQWCITRGLHRSE